MPVMTDIVTNELLAEMVERLYTTDGCNYNAANRKQILPRLEKVHKYILTTTERDTMNFKELLCAGVVKQYCDDMNHHGSIKALCRDFIILTRGMDANADVKTLETLQGIAGKEDEERRAAGREEKAVPFSDFKGKANDIALKIMAHGLTDHELSKLVLVGTEIVLAPARANNLSPMRHATAADFDPAVQHSQEAFDELCKQYPKSTHMCLATMTFDANNNPVKMYLGIYGTEKTKNSYYCEIDMSVATLPELQHLVSMVNTGYTELYTKRLEQGHSFLFNTSTGDGSRPIGRNQSQDWIKELTGHPVGILRRSIQDHAFDLYIVDSTKFNLEALTLCITRCQHRAETACKQYMTETIKNKRERLAQTEVTGAVEAIVDEVENNDTTDTTVENTEDTVENDDTMGTTVENIEDTEVTEDTDTEEDTESSSESEDENDGDDGPGPAVRALIAAFTAAYESDRKRRRR
jgi:hypothetical protein